MSVAGSVVEPDKMGDGVEVKDGVLKSCDGFERRDGREVVERYRIYFLGDQVSTSLTPHRRYTTITTLWG